MQSLSQIPTEDWFVQDPYPFYQKARSLGDLFYWEDYDRICASTYPAVQSLLRDKRWGREVPAEFTKPVPNHIKPFMEIEKHSMLELEPPIHTRLRSQVVRAFTSRRIAAFESEIEALSHTLIDGFTGDTVDLLPAFCEIIPVTIIARLLGVPEEMSRQLLDWSHDMVGMYQANRDYAAECAAARAATEFGSFISDHITKCSASPKDDLISALIAAETNDGTLSREEITTTCILLLIAGHEATVHSLGNAVKTVLESGLNAESLYSEGCANATVEECLRFDPPLHLFERHAKEDLEMFGHSFKRGDTVALLLASANRDGTVFEHADQFLPERTRITHQSFGAGIHFCVGAPLARLEMTKSLNVLFSRLPNLKLAETPRYADKYHFHGLERLQVTIG